MSSTTIKFNNRSYTDFVNELKDKVNSYFDKNHLTTYANNEMKIKTLVMMACYGVPYICMMTIPMSSGVMLMLCVIMGIGIAGIGLAVQHDANHQAYSAKPWVNRVLGFTMSLIGGSDYMWRIKHNLFHHTYTNIYGKDEDISVASFLRLSPRDRHKPVHRIQHWIAIFAYSTLTLGWVMYFDYPKLFRYNGNGSPNPEVKHPWQEVLLLLGSKIFY
ncbi:MAG: fatty acid desaturase, partial [Cytophagales bacterium]|nr:fatty acid desaturase [Cytophagales bacterium]